MNAPGPYSLPNPAYKNKSFFCTIFSFFVLVVLYSPTLNLSEYLWCFFLHVNQTYEYVCMYMNAFILHIVAKVQCSYKSFATTNNA